MHKTLRMILLIAILTVSTSRAWAQYRLVKSNVAIIDKMTEKYIGQSLSLNKIDEIVREISQDGLFQIVYVEQLDGNKVIVRAQQSRKISEINITGNTSYQQDEILEALELSTGEIVSDLEVMQGIERVKEMYRDSGFFNFSIQYSKKISADGLELNIKVAEKDYCVIDEINIFTKNPLLKKKFAESILEFKGSNYQKDTVSKITQQLNNVLLENRFLVAKLQNTATIFNQDKTRVKINFSVSNPTQFEFVFNGNSYFSHFDLVKQSEIGSKFLYLSDASSEIVDSIYGVYLKAGFPNVAIKTKEKYFEDLNKKVFIFSIEEGARIRIGRVEIVGKISRPKSYYESIFHDYLSREAHSVYFVQKDIEHAAGELVTHLRRQGHLQAELLSINHELTKSDKAQVTIQIDEGILTYVRQILFRGAKSFSNIELKSVVEIEANKPLLIKQVEDSFDKLEVFYKNQAYLEFKIKNRDSTVIQYQPGQPYADIVYQVSEGPKIKVKNIEISGATKTKHYVIMRELDFSIGELLTLDKVNNSVSRLERTGLFGKVNIRSLEQGSADNLRTIVVEVEDRKPGIFSAGVGLGNETGIYYRSYLGALYNNLGGKARGVSSRVDLKYQERVKYLENRISLGYYEPFIFEDRVRGRVSVVREEQLFTLNQENATILSTNDFRFSAEKEFSRHFRFTYNVWKFSNQVFFDTNKQDDRKILNIATTGPIFEFDYRNDPFLPTKGHYSRLEIEYSDPIIGSSRDNAAETGFNANGSRADKNNEIHYYRATLSTTHYTPITKSRRWVWANSLRGGYLKNISNRNDSGVPQSRSFFLGGSSTIRGFNIGEAVPGTRELCLAQNLLQAGQNTNECDLAEVFVRDDSVFFLVKSELRFPISGNFGGSVFYDGGAVFLGEFSLEDPYRDAVGIGFRYDTPVGAFSVEFGYKLDRKLGGLDTKYDPESEIAVHLSIGTF